MVPLCRYNTNLPFPRLCQRLLSSSEERLALAEELYSTHNNAIGVCSATEIQTGCMKQNSAKGTAVPGKQEKQE